MVLLPGHSGRSRDFAWCQANDGKNLLVVSRSICVACSKIAVGVGTLRGPLGVAPREPELHYNVLPLLSAVLNICYANVGTLMCQDNRQGLCTWSAWGACSACAVCSE